MIANDGGGVLYAIQCFMPYVVLFNFRVNLIADTSTRCLSTLIQSEVPRVVLLYLRVNFIAETNTCCLRFELILL